MNAPLVLTVKLDDASFAFFTQLRQKHFPPERNFLFAHLTLFHHLPHNQPSIVEELSALSQKQEVLLLKVTDVASIGKGVAYKINSLPLLMLHKRLQQRWSAWLTPQDKQRLWPHITIQNKVTPATAKETLLQLKANFEQFTGKGVGLQLWVYEGGPWKFISDFPFTP